jgi:serpin B
LLIIVVANIISRPFQGDIHNHGEDRMKRGLIVVLGMLLAIMSVAGGGCVNSTSEASVAQSTEARITTPQVTSDESTALAAGNGAFAFDLYQAMRGEPGNLFYSPYSISSALAMTYAGARGSTETQMAKTMHFTLSQDRLHPAFNALDLALASRGQGSQGQDNKGFRLKIANSVWGQKGYPFDQAYLDVLAKNYGAGLQLTDFQKSPEPSRAAINAWVKAKTENKIIDLLPQGSITDLTRLVLANAVYFNAAWDFPFSKESTHDRDFTLLDGTKVKVPMMFQKKTHGYVRGQGYQVVELAYDGREIVMDILMPDVNNMATFEKSLTSEQVNSILRNLKPTEMDLTIPKFNYGANLNLTKVLKALGLEEALTPGKADFSGMSSNKDLYISDVVHKAIVVVDEKGTEAAAATGVMVGTTAMPIDNVSVTIDHPFVFLIRDVKTNTVLFVGRVVNPAN